MWFSEISERMDEAALRPVHGKIGNIYNGQNEERTLIDQVVSRVSDHPDAVDDQATDELRQDDDGVQSKSEGQPQSQVLVARARGHHAQ